MIYELGERSRTFLHYTEELRLKFEAFLSKVNAYVNEIDEDFRKLVAILREYLPKSRRQTQVDKKYLRDIPFMISDVNEVGNDLLEQRQRLCDSYQWYVRSRNSSAAGLCRMLQVLNVPRYFLNVFEKRHQSPFCPVRLGTGNTVNNSKMNSCTDVTGSLTVQSKTNADVEEPHTRAELLNLLHRVVVNVKNTDETARSFLDIILTIIISVDEILFQQNIFTSIILLPPSLSLCCKQANCGGNKASCTLLNLTQRIFLKFMNIQNVCTSFYAQRYRRHCLRNVTDLLENILKRPAEELHKIKRQMNVLLTMKQDTDTDIL